MRFPKLLLEGRTQRLEELQLNIQKELNYVNRKLNIAITRIPNPYGNPNILAEFIAGQLKNRVSFRKAMKKAIELTEQADTNGMQILQGTLIEKKSHVLNGLERVGFLNKPFELKLIIVFIFQGIHITSGFFPDLASIWNN